MTFEVLTVGKRLLSICNTMQLSRQVPTFWRNLLLTSSGWETYLRAEAAHLPKVLVPIYQLQDITSQKIVTFID
jgi:hypothetical protein